MKIIKLFMALCFLYLLNGRLFAQWIKLNSGLDGGRFYAVYFTNDSTGYVVGHNDTSGVIFKTTDGGATWSSTPIIINNTVLKAVYFPSDSVGYAAGLNSVVVKTTDAGTTWNLANTGIPLDNMFVSAFFLNNDTGYIGTENSVAEIFRTTDGGITWTDITDTNMYEARSIYFVSNTVGYTIGSFFHKTTDAGNSWTRYPVPEMEYLSMQFLNDTVGFAAGMGADSILNYGTIIKSTNGGTTWNNQTFHNIVGLYSIFFPSQNIGYCVGGPSYATSSGTILKTIDGGATWVTQLDTGLPPYLLSVHCLNDSLCYAVGDVGLILKTTNGGGPLNTSNIKSNVQSIDVFPVPASSLITVLFNLTKPENVSIQIFSFTGQLIKTIPVGKRHGSFTYSVDFSSFANGVYMLQINTGNNRVSKKVIKYK